LGRLPGNEPASHSSCSSPSLSLPPPHSLPLSPLSFLHPSGLSAQVLGGLQQRRREPDCGRAHDERPGRVRLRVPWQQQQAGGHAADRQVSEREGGKRGKERKERKRREAFQSVRVQRGDNFDSLGTRKPGSPGGLRPLPSRTPAGATARSWAPSTSISEGRPRGPPGPERPRPPRISPRPSHARWVCCA
jgi:hypothetical protein